LARRSFTLAPLIGLCAAVLLAGTAAADRDRDSGELVEGRYIVVYDGPARNVAAKTDRRERRLDFESRLRFTHALNGFSADLSPTQVRDLREDPAVDFLSPVRRYHVAAEVPLASGESVPSDLRRIGAATQTTVRQQSGVAVAVVDTGIQLSHPDLNAVSGKNCAGGSSTDDDHGHGTLVAGIIGAENDGSGIVGVAPGTTLYSVKVFNSSGDGDSETIACGIEWITANHQALGIKVANLSLTGEGQPLGECGSLVGDPEHEAICEATAAGINFVVAAGNESQSIEDPLVPVAPAVYPEVLTVTAMADTDGEPGGLGGGSGGCGFGSQSDDTAASFSNFATEPATQAHTVAGPGECIASTATGSGYETSSGTSFATPHVSGLVALCINEAGVSGPCAGLTPAQVIAHLRGTAEAYNTANPNYGFTGDPLHSPSASYYGFLVTANPPPACRNVSVQTGFRTPVSIGLACAGSGQINHEIVSGPAGGELSGLSPAAGTLTYTPDPGFIGSDSFTFRATGANGTSNTATVTVTVDPPPPPVCEDRSVGAASGQPKTINLDCSGQGAIRHEIVTGPADGDVSGFNRTAGRLTYTADKGFGGQDSFTYVASNQGGESAEATVDINVTRPSNKFSFGGVNRNENRGIAKLTIRTPGPGKLALKKSGTVKRHTRTASVSVAAKRGKVKLKVRPRGGAKRKLAKSRCATRSGSLRVRVRVKVTYRPEGGIPRSKKKRVKLVRSC
jgi:hypothetical protein